jgi:hypothetical protein
MTAAIALVAGRGRSSFERQQDREFGAAWLAFHFDQPVVLLHESLRKREAKSAAVFSP